MYEVVNWDFKPPASAPRPDKMGARKYSTSNMPGLTRGLYDDTHERDDNRKYAALNRLTFGVPAGGRTCMQTGNGNVFPEQHYPSTAADVRVESNLRRQGTGPSLAVNGGYYGPKGRTTSCNDGNAPAALLSDWSMNGGRAALSEDYNREMDKFRTVNDTVPYMHSFAYRQSIFGAIADPVRTGVVSQIEIRSLYPVLFNPGQSATQSAYATTAQD